MNGIKVDTVVTLKFVGGIGKSIRWDIVFHLRFRSPCLLVVFCFGFECW